MEDVKVKTKTGAFCEQSRYVIACVYADELVCTVTILSAAIILTFTTMEFLDYRRVNMDTSIVVDKSRGEKLNVKMNITFPKVPCYRELHKVRCRCCSVPI